MAEVLALFLACNHMTSVGFEQMVEWIGKMDGHRRFLLRQGCYLLERFSWLAYLQPSLLVLVVVLYPCFELFVMAKVILFVSWRTTSEDEMH